eukprot:2002907-Rhodomonas_salina.6
MRGAGSSRFEFGWVWCRENSAGRNNLMEEATALTNVELQHVCWPRVLELELQYAWLGDRGAGRLAVQCRRRAHLAVSTQGISTKGSWEPSGGG